MGKLEQFLKEIEGKDPTQIQIPDWLKQANNRIEQEDKEAKAAKTEGPKQATADEKKGASHGLPSKHPKKEVKNTKTPGKQAKAKRKANPETSGGNVAVGVGAAILLNQLGRGHDVGHHEHGIMSMVWREGARR